MIRIPYKVYYHNHGIIIRLRFFDRHGSVRAASLVGILSFHSLLYLAGWRRMHELHAARTRLRLHRHHRGQHIGTAYLTDIRTPSRLVPVLFDQRPDLGRR